MKKIAIISYYYPPCNLTASQRAYAFAKYFPANGFYPIVITRNWDFPLKNQFDTSIPSGTKVVHENLKNGEVYYLPFKGSLRDKFISTFGSKRFVLLRRILTFIELLLEHIELFSKNKNLFLKHADQVVTQENAEYLIISGNPFWQFYIGYKLKTKHPQLKWIADYRDDWTTHNLGRKYDVASDLIHWLSKRKEKKWLQNASLVTSVSNILSQRIGDNVNIPFKTIANGFFEDIIIPEKRVIRMDEFIITYTGYLYEEQRIELFLTALKKIIDKYGDRMHIKIQFIGVAYDKVAENRLRLFMKGYEKNLLITERLSLIESMQIEVNSDLVLMVAYDKHKGIPSSKLYQYIGNQKPIFLYPTDGDIVQFILEETGLGIICSNEKEAFRKLDELVNLQQNGKALLSKINSQRIMKYSRSQQVEKLANTIKNL